MTLYHILFMVEGVGEMHFQIKISVKYLLYVSIVLECFMTSYFLI